MTSKSETTEAPKLGKWERRVTGWRYSGGLAWVRREERLWAVSTLAALSVIAHASTLAEAKRIAEREA